MSQQDVTAPAQSHTVDEFCELERISRGTLYNLWRRNQGPRYMQVGAHRRITEKARQDWHREREAAVNTNEAA